MLLKHAETAVGKRNKSSAVTKCEMWEVIRRSTPGYVRTYLPLFQFLNFPFQTPSCLPHIKKKSLKRNQAVDAHVILISFFQNSTTWGSIKAERLLLMSCYYCWYSGVVQVLYSMYNVASPIPLSQSFLSPYFEWSSKYFRLHPQKRKETISTRKDV